MFFASLDGDIYTFMYGEHTIFFLYRLAGELTFLRPSMH